MELFEKIQVNEKLRVIKGTGGVYAIVYWHKTNGWTKIEVVCEEWKILGFADSQVGGGGYELLREFAERADSLVRLHDLSLPPAAQPITSKEE